MATVRTADKKSPREAVEFILQLLKYNDNSGNPYSDVFWLAALVEAVGELEFGPQCTPYLQSLLKQIDRLLQFDRLMSSYNGILTISCIRTITQMAFKLSEFIPLDRVTELIKSFRDFKATWQVRIEASRALLDLEFYCKGIDAALILFIKYLEEEPSLRGQAKLGVHMIRLSEISAGSGLNDDVKSRTLVALLRLLEGRLAFCNVLLRHHLFCILQVLAGRSPTLYVIPRDHMRQMGYAEICSEQRNTFLAFINQIKPQDPPVDIHSPFRNGLVVQEGIKDVATTSNSQERRMQVNGLVVEEPPFDVDITSSSPEKKSEDNGLVVQEAVKDIDTIANDQEPKLPADGSAVQETLKGLDTVSNSQERKMPVVKIRVKQPTTSNRVDEGDNMTHERSQAAHKEIDHEASSSVSVDAPQRNAIEVVSASNQIIEEVNSCQGRGSQMTASIGSAKVAREGDDLGKDLQCTADSSSIPMLPQPDDRSSPNIVTRYDLAQKLDVENHDLLPRSLFPAEDVDGGSLSTANPDVHDKKEKKKKKDKDKKRKRDDPEYLERKRLKKEKKKREKERAKLLNDDTRSTPIDPLLDRRARDTTEIDNFRPRPSELEVLVTPSSSMSKNESGYQEGAVRLKPDAPSKNESEHREATIRLKPDEQSGPKIVLRTSETTRPGTETGRKIKIKIKKPGASGAS